MTKLKKYWPFIVLCLIIFFSGRWTKDDNSKELKEKYEQERQRDRDSISVLLKNLTAKHAESRTINEERIQDSLRFADALERNQRAYNSLKRKYNEVNFNRFSAARLDSIVSELYPD